MNNYEVIYYHEEDAKSEYVSMGICQGIRSARKLAYETYNKESKFSDIIVEILNNAKYTIETISYRTVYGEELA